MPEADGLLEQTTKDYRSRGPAPRPAVLTSRGRRTTTGASSIAWRAFSRPGSGRTVMLAVDHGYFQGPTTGLERIDLDIVPLLPDADALMCTRGALRSMIPPADGSPVVLRAPAAVRASSRSCPTRRIAIDIEDAVRLGVSALAVQVFIGGEHETQSVHNMTRLVDAGIRYGIPVMAVVAVGKELVRDAQYFRLACRVLRRARRPVRQDLLLAEDFDLGRSVVPRADRHGRRQEAARAAMPWRWPTRRSNDGAAGRRHGSQHLPERRARGDDPSGARRRARRPRSRRRLRAVSDARA